MKKILLFLLVSNWICAQWSISNAERDALIGIYNTTSGTQWSQSWDLGTDPRNWYGIVVKNGRVQEINLKGNALKGTFPANLATFKNLIKLDLSSNQLSGEVSPSLSSLSYLTRLDISHNRLTGDPSTALTNFSQLQELSIGDNLFQVNDINTLLQNSNNIQVLNLSHLGLATVPQKISSYPSLTQLDLSNNNIATGFNILRSLTRLQYLSLAGNQLTGVPSDISVLIGLTSLDFSNNQLVNNFTGLSALSSLEWLSLENNLFTQVPLELMQTPNLVHLNLDKNKINTGLANLLNLKKLQQLYLNDNNLVGAFPSELLSLSQLMMISVANNNLEGAIPNNLPIISDISNNRFTTASVQNYLTATENTADQKYYSPQRYDAPEQVLGVLGQSAKLTQSLSGTDYSFSWYKNLGDYTQVNTENYNFGSVQQSDYAIYTAEAFYVKKLTNYVIELSLFREPISLVENLATEETRFKDLRVFPIPTTQYLNIVSTKYTVEQSTIYDLSGKQIMTTKQHQINVAHLPSGTYMLNVKTSEGYKSFKFIKH